jgi:hypothetical protein
LDSDLATQVTIQLTNHNVLEAHARDELGINEISQPKPLQAVLALGGSLFLEVYFHFWSNYLHHLIT